MDFPERIKIIEVGPRDGFQNLQKFIPTKIKQNVIDAIIASGVKSMEITSFVHPKAVPQMADAKEIASETLQKHPEIEAVALIPNMKGAQNAYEAGIRDMAYVIAASEQFNLKNVNRTIDESLADLKKILNEMPDINVKLSIATAFGCPYAGTVSEKSVIELLETALSIGVKDIALCDTIGVGNPIQSRRMSKKAKAYESKEARIGLHMHNTRGMGLANILAAMDAGISIFETSIGGLGGCPFAPGAAGNTATEDVLNMLLSMGIETGIDMDQYLKAVELVKEHINNNLASNMAKAERYNCLYIDTHSI